MKMYRLNMLLGVALIIGACSPMPETDSQSGAAELNSRILFALQGNARLQNNQLTVEAAHVDWFTDRPERYAGRMTTQAFVESWDRMGFDNVPPNAFLAGAISDIVVVLETPEIAAHGVTFRVSDSLNGTTGTGELGSIAVFIDSKNNGLLGPGK